MARYNNTDETIKAIRNRFKVYFEIPCDSDDHRVQEIIGIVIRTIEEQPTADVVPKSEEGAECPTCYGTGRIGTTNWLTKNISKKQLAEEKAKAIAEHEQYIKTECAREIFGEIEKHILENCCVTDDDVDGIWKHIAELKKKYTGEK